MYLVKYAKLNNNNNNDNHNKRKHNKQTTIKYQLSF